MPNPTVRDISEMDRNNVESFSFVLACLFCVIIVFILFFMVKTEGSSGLSFDNRININSANSASLIRLTGIGLVRAEAIVSFRERLKQSSGDDLVFKRAERLWQN